MGEEERKEDWEGEKEGKVEEQKGYQTMVGNGGKPT